MAENTVLDRVGHGALGLRSNLRSFADFLEETSSRKDVAVEFRPGQIVEEWAVHSGSTYVAPLEVIFDDLRLDVVFVATDEEPSLTRAESLALCIATAGTFYYDPDEEFQDPFNWDSDSWDDGVSRWDQSPKLYVHLLDGSDPNDTTVAAHVSLTFATRGMVQPSLGPEKFVDGGFEVWTSGTNLTNWTEVMAAGFSVFQDSTQPKEGSYEAFMLCVASTGVGALSPAVAIPFVVGARYRMSGWYLTPEGMAGTTTAELYVSDTGGTDFIFSNGRDHGAGGTVPLEATNGEWRRFSFEFVAHVSSGYAGILIRATASVTLGILFDGLSLKRVWRESYYEPRVSGHSLPTVETGSNDIYFGGKRIGLGRIALNNGDGLLERIGAQLEWLNHEVHVWVGGEFQDGQEIPFEDYRRQFTGLVQAQTVDDAEIAFELQDSRILLNTNLPPNTYDDVTFPDIADDFNGEARPIWFGPKENISPAGIARDPTYAKYRKYELADASQSPNGIKEITTVYAYTDKASADDRLSTKRVTLSVSSHYTTDLANARLTVIVDVGPYIVDATNCKLNFNQGASELTANVAKALYTAGQLATAIQTAMNAVGTGITVSYSESTNKFTISKASGTLQLLCSTGTNKEISIYSLIGFDRAANKTGSLSYTGDDATFVDADTDHVIRVDGQGFKDTAAGKYTGSASALIQVGADICQVLIEKYLKKPYNVIDQVTFLAARTAAPEVLTIYLNELTSTKDVFETLEFSNLANIVVDGSGVVSYRVYEGTTPANIVDLSDRDFMPGGWTGARAVTDVYRGCVVKYDQDPSTGEFRGVQSSDDTVPRRYGRIKAREFKTYLRIADNAASLSTRLLTLAQRPARRFSIVTKGRLVDKEVGDKVRITRRRGFDPNGRLDGQVFRIISLKKNPHAGRVEADVVDDVVTVAGIQCVTVCQQFCELVQQGNGCVVSCQEACQKSCQVGCQAVVQGCGFTICQTICESTTQGGCVTGCQISCQSTCQTSCQSCGQAGLCQSTCETTCQGCGQATCQQTCQLSCQNTCQITCQASCQVVCQLTSEFH